MSRLHTLTFSLVVVVACNVGAALAMFKAKSIETSGRTPAELVKRLRKDDSIAISNVQMTGSKVQLGIFKDKQKVTGMRKGIIMSTGNVMDMDGANGEDDAATALGLPGDSDLETVLDGYVTRDAVALEFDFVPKRSRIRVSYVFGSEEYFNGFDGHSFNDGFAILVNGKNCALVPGSKDVISVNTINEFENAEVYVDNNPTDGLGKKLEFDGFTRVLKCIATVKRNQVNHMKIVLADGAVNEPNDDIDSAALLRFGSLK